MNSDCNSDNDIRFQRGVYRAVIVEDETLVRELLLLHLRDHPRFELAGVAADGAEGLALCELTRPDVVLLDLMLPTMNGTEVADRLRATVPDARILAMSAVREPALIRAAIGAGIRGFIEKRASVETLIEALITVASGGQYFGREALAAISDPADSEGLALLKLLTRREIEVLREVARGHSVKEISAALAISENTVKMHRKNLMQKLGAHDAVGLARFALRHRLVSLDF
jgi:DNA-binding NarL/FixJ family response regulator